VTARAGSRKILWGLTVSVLLPALWLAPGAAGGARTVPAQEPGSAAPAAVHEYLVYRVVWDPPWYFFLLPTMEAGETTLSIAGETQDGGERILRIVFTARSSGTLARLAGYKVDDRFEFETDPESYCTRRVTKRVREGNRMRDLSVEYLPSRRCLHLREVDVSKAVPTVLRDKEYEDIPPCVKDLFSALYSVRRSAVAAGTSRKVLVGDNEVVKEVEVRVGQKARVRTPSGDYDALQIDTVAVMGGLFKSGGQFRLWLSADERKLPVKFEARVSLGRVVGTLVAAR
jgi:hypothetical protein